MRLRDLAGIDTDSEVTGFAIDHRKVASGSLLWLAFRDTLTLGAIWADVPPLVRGVFDNTAATFGAEELSAAPQKRLGGRHTGFCYS